MKLPSRHAVACAIALFLVTATTAQGDHSIMNAVALTCKHGAGDPPFSCVQLRKLPVPYLQRGQVLVRVHASSVNPVDYKVSGSLRIVQKIVNVAVSSVVIANRNSLLGSSI